MTKHKNDNETKRQTRNGFPSGIIRQNWNETEKISTAPAQG